MNCSTFAAIRKHSVINFAFCEKYQIPPAGPFFAVGYRQLPGPVSTPSVGQIADGYVLLSRELPHFENPAQNG